MKKIYVFFVFIFLFIKNLSTYYCAEEINLESGTLSISHGGKKKLNGVVASIGENIKIKSDLLIFENDKVFEFIDNVIVYVEDDIKITCQKCVYSAHEQTVVFYDVNIIKNDITFSSSKCYYYIKKKILEYKDGGRICKEQTTIFGQNGTFYIAEGRIQMSNNIIIEIIFNDKNIKIKCDIFDYNITKKKVFLDGNTKIETDIGGKDNFILTTLNNVRYEIDNGMVFFEKIKFNFKNNVGTSNTAVFDLNKSEIKIKGNVQLKLFDGSELICGSINYDFLKNNGLCDGKPIVSINKNTKICFEDIAFNL